jgi:hypothetical protein
MKKLFVAMMVLVLSTSAMAVGGGGGGKGGKGGGEGGDRVFEKSMQHLKAAQAAKK